MSVVQEPEVKWTPEQMVEVTLNEPDDFLKVRETLTKRIYLKMIPQQNILRTSSIAVCLDILIQFFLQTK